MQWFTLYRFLISNCKKKTIEQNYSAINDLFIKNGHAPEMWKKNNHNLKYILQVVNDTFPPGKGSKPNDEKFTLSLKKRLNLKFITHFTIWTSWVLAYCFALRICEYSSTKHYDSPHLSAVKLIKTEGGNNSLLYVIPKSKRNKNSDGKNPEMVQACCSCPKLCILCQMLRYLKWRLKVQKFVRPKYKHYLFLIEKRVKIKNSRNDRKRYHFIINKNNEYITELIPLQAAHVRLLLDQAATLEYGPKHGHSPHGFRSGGLTDLVLYGLSETAIKGISRHTKDSDQLLRYIKFTPEHVSSLVKNAKVNHVDNLI